MNNGLLAKTLFSNKLATREQIEQYWPLATPERNIAVLLRDAGVLDANVCEQVLAFVRKMDEPPSAPAQVPSSIPDDDDLPEERPMAYVAPVSAPVAAPMPMAEGGADDVSDVEQGEVPMAELAPGSVEAAEVPSAQSVSLAIEGNNPYGSMLGAGQVVPVVDGLQSNRIAAAAAPRPESLATFSTLLPQKFVLADGAGEWTGAVPRRLDADSTLAHIVAFARQKMATDVYLQPGTPILLRRGGHMLMASESAHSGADVERWIGESAAGHAEGLAPVKGVGSCRAIGLPGLGRVRMTVEWASGVPLVSLRLIPVQDASLRELNLPEFCADWALGSGGLVLIAGGASSGRTTTLYAMGQRAVKQRAIHLQTLENPIERLLLNPRGILAQTEVGTHVATALQGIRNALDDAPDVFLFDGLKSVAELQGLLQLANAGTQVFATAMGNNSLGLFMRIFEAVSVENRDVLRNQMAELLRGVVCQHLIPLQSGAGLALAVEAFKVTPVISSLIRKNDLHQLPSTIAGLKQYGVGLDDSLHHLLENGQIAGVDAWSRALDSRRFTQHKPQVRKK
jgi:Tfp pilus assembly pilus retraction ATPase PilT